MKTKTILKVLMLQLMLCIQISLGQTLPVSYYTVDSTAASTDNRGVYAASIGGTYGVTTLGKVGKYMTWGTGTSLCYVTPTTTTITGSFTVEFIIKPGRDFNTTDLVKKVNGGWSFKIDLPQNNNCVPRLAFTVNTGTTTKLEVLLDGSGRKSIHNLLDGGWHHIALQYNTSNGIRKIFVDGICPTGFSDTISGTPLTTGDQRIVFNSVTSYRKYYGGIDEIAVYNSAINPLQIYQHFLNMVAGNHYSFTNAGSIPAATISTGLDSMDFAPGTILPTSGTQTTGASQAAFWQLYNYPSPRFRTGHKLKRNFDWMQLDYMSGRFQSGVNSDSMARTAAAINLELAMRFNYMLLLNPNSSSNTSSYTDTTTTVGKLVKQANANPSIPAGIITFWSQLNPSVIGRPSGGSYAFKDSLPANYYVRNDAGAFLTLAGAVTTTPSQYVLSPACPLDSIVLDGMIQQKNLQNLKNALTRPLNYCSENDEVIPAWSSTVLATDPTVVAQKNASGLDWNQYMGWRRQVITAAYRDNALSQFTTKPSFQVYKTEGRSIVDYSKYRTINYPISSTYYPCPDFYPRWPSNWRNWNSSWNGLQHIIESRNVEIPLNDRLFSPFVSAGWNEIEDGNIRPGDWLGLLKLLATSGAEYFHSGFFNEASSYNPPNPPPANPKNYVWQVSMPAYAQAAISRYEGLLFSGSLLSGDVPMSLDPPKTGLGYQFKTGNPHIPIMGRKLATGPVYLITGAIPRTSNDKLNAPLADTVTAYIDGDTLQFQVRRQGSMYVYDKRDTANKLWYQLDKWHEASHPSRWSQDLVLEAELYDSSSATITMKTQVPSNARKGDYTGSFTYTILPALDSETFKIQPSVAGIYYVYVKAKHGASSSGALSFIAAGFKNTVTNISSQTFKWYKVSIGNLTRSDLNLQMIASQGKICVDKLVISKNPDLRPDQLDSK